MTSWLCRVALLTLLPLGGCFLYEQDPPPCSTPDIEYQRVRNPITARCEQPDYGDCGVYDVAEPPLTGWGVCDTFCETLGENACIADPSCQAAYGSLCYDSGCDLSGSFIGCWALGDYSQPGACSGLAAEACTARSDCSPVYFHVARPNDDGAFEYSHCVAEASPELCTADTDCGDGERCNLTDYCYPHPSCRDGETCPPVCYGKCEPTPSTGCELIDCSVGYHCEVVCTTDDPLAGCSPGPNGDCAPPCQATCVPDEIPVGECTGDVLCDSLPPACPSGTTPGISNGCWSGYCIPLTECGHEPGECFVPGEPICRQAPPACPAETVPGVANGCWTGYCIPAWACDEPATCESLSDENACVGRTDCAPVYEGIGCTCDAAGNCVCRDQRYSRCESSLPRP